mmetsp:Transcript_7473/g.21808  ORF Transcript_7473/g.21808 Transcript_7473/m.21808 type:complete len:122 (-) Transcript_7473:530-895(-)
MSNYERPNSCTLTEFLCMKAKWIVTAQFGTETTNSAAYGTVTPFKSMFLVAPYNFQYLVEGRIGLEMGTKTFQKARCLFFFLPSHFVSKPYDPFSDHHASMHQYKGVSQDFCHAKVSCRLF